MARIGSIPAAPFMGDQFVSLYVGATRVPTVPGRPRVNTAYGTYIDATEPDNDGASVITGWFVYADGVSQSVDEAEFVGDDNWELYLSNDALVPGQAVQISAINAVGEGPRSAPFTAVPSP